MIKCTFSVNLLLKCNIHIIRCTNLGVTAQGIFTDGYAHITQPEQNKTSALCKPLYPLPPSPRVTKILTSIPIDLFLPHIIFFNYGNFSPQKLIYSQYYYNKQYSSNVFVLMEISYSDFFSSNSLYY